MDTEILQASLMTPGLYGRWGLPRMYWGPPGVGKTSRLNAVVNGLGMWCVTILASIRDPADFNGIPIPGEVEIDGKKYIVMTMAPPDWAVKASTRGPGVVFFDEMSCASPAVQAATLRVILEGAVGDFGLSDDVRFMASGNPTDMASGGFDMTPAQANRFGHEDVNLGPEGKASISNPEVEDWCDWLLANGKSESDTNVAADPVARQKEILKQWPDAYGQARGEIVGFMYSTAGGPSALLKMPDLTDPHTSRAWASPRAWECAARAIASARIHNLSGIKTDKWMASHVGMGPVAQFRAYTANADLPNAREFLSSGGKGWKHDPARNDRTLAVMVGCTGLVTSMDDADPDKAAFTDTLWRVMTPIAEKSADVCVPAVRSLITAGLAHGKTAAKPLAKMRKVLKAVGKVKDRGSRR